MYKVRRRWTIREVDLHPDLLLSKRRLLKWFALSLGLIGENDTREGMLELLDVMFTFWFAEGKDPAFEEIKHRIEKKYLERGKSPPSDEAIRKHLRRLVEVGLVYRETGRYRLFTVPSRPDDYLSSIDAVFSRLEGTKELIKTGFSHLKRMYVG